nr:MAG TPA: hypothetical protein [Caudoviricetes sp.]
MPQNKTNHQKPNTNTLVTLQNPLQPTRAERPQKVLVSSTPKTTHMKCVRHLSCLKNLATTRRPNQTPNNDKNLSPPGTNQHPGDKTNTIFSLERR